VYFYPSSQIIWGIEGTSKKTYPFLKQEECDRLDLYSAVNYLRQKIIKESKGVITNHDFQGFEFDIDKKKQAVKNFNKVILQYKCELHSASTPLKGVGVIFLNSIDTGRQYKDGKIVKANKIKQKEKDLKETGKFKNF
jgi:hypothetical protein